MESNHPPLTYQVSVLADELTAPLALIIYHKTKAITIVEKLDF